MKGRVAVITRYNADFELREYPVPELELLAGLAGVEMTLKSFGVPVTLGAGVAAAQSYLLDTRPS